MGSKQACAWLVTFSQPRGSVWWGTLMPLCRCIESHMLEVASPGSTHRHNFDQLIATTLINCHVCRLGVPSCEPKDTLSSQVCRAESTRLWTKVYSSTSCLQG